jgi:hypothetical protein
MNQKKRVEANGFSPLDLSSGTPILNASQKASQESEKAQDCFVTREANWWVMTPGLIALINFFIILYSVLVFGQSSTTSFLLVSFGSLAFLMLVLHPAATKIKVTKKGIDWKVFGIGTFISYDDLKEISVRRFCLKLDVGKWRTICPVNRDGFLMAVREAKPDLQITGWKHQR